MNVAPLYTGHKAMRKSSHNVLVCISTIKSIVLTANLATAVQGQKIVFTVQTSGYPRSTLIEIHQFTDSGDFFPFTDPTQIFTGSTDGRGRAVIEGWSREFNGTVVFAAILPAFPSAVATVRLYLGLLPYFFYDDVNAVELAVEGIGLWGGIWDDASHVLTDSLLVKLGGPLPLGAGGPLPAVYHYGGVDHIKDDDAYGVYCPIGTYDSGAFTLRAA
jgi:hypothetical protein